MKIEISTKNYDVPEKLAAVIEKKLNRLDKYFDDGKEVKAKVMLRQDKDFMTMEVTLFADKIIRSEVGSLEMYDNIDVIMPKIERQIIKYKTKTNNKQKKNTEKEREFFFETVKEEERKIIKKKQFVLKPMLTDEAVENLELLDHNFYVFLNSHTNEVNIAYRRADGNYGIIETKLK